MVAASYTYGLGSVPPAADGAVFVVIGFAREGLIGQFGQFESPAEAL